jgi:hypothetical protein
MRLGSANRSLHSGKAQSKTAPNKLPTISLADGGGFEPPVPFGTHAFQACTIDRSVTHPFACCSAVYDRSLHPGAHRPPLQLSKLQSAEQFVERQLNADVKFAEVRVLGAHRIETHFVNYRLDLKCVAREQSHTPLRIIQAC